MLKIKNVKAYRTYFKENVRRYHDNSRDEHLLPPFHEVNGEKTFGWFEIYYGDSEGFGNAETGIRSKLLSFLRMAKDGQAVYEFLQNAVDEGSEHFSMIWGKDKEDGKQYLLVANNGRMFTKDNVRSILNIGGSTKTANHNDIGKFGIGFKLAHRLVGADDGLEELIAQYCGPVLFSWQNNEIEQLANGEPIEPKDVDFEQETTGGYPWLFKILLTCFPCLPENGTVEERPRLMQGEQANNSPFADSELQALSRWTKKLLDKVGDVSYKEGSLFFMQLGKGKDQELHDKNLEEGVKFSMGVLRETGNNVKNGGAGLQTVQLNGGRKITLPELEYERFIIDNTHPAYSEIFEGQSLSELEKIQHIDFLLGFRPYEKIDRFFHGAPNFYLFFPLSEEVHQFNFILHCNAFDNSSSRTFLQSGKNGRNEKLLIALAQHIMSRLKELSFSDTKRFLDLYGALLTSGSSKSANKEWINKQFTYPLNDFLKTLIPVQEPDNAALMTLLKEGQTAYIKNTSVEVDLISWGLDDVRWFFWEGREYGDFTREATSNYKLDLKPFGIYDLLTKSGISEHLNTWMAAEKGRTNMVLRELDSQPIPKNQADVIDNLVDLNILEFSDGEVFSFNRLDEAQEQGYLLVHNTLSDIREILLKVGFKTTRYDFSNSQLLDALRNNVKNTSQLKSYAELVKLFSHTISNEAINQLTPDEKYRVYEAFRNLNEKHRTDRMPHLKLFKNKSGQIVYLKNILQATDKKWLEPYTLHPDEAHLKLDYTVSKIEDVYSQLIHPFWPDIANRIAANSETAPQVLHELLSLYEKAKERPALSGKLAFFKGNAESHSRIFFHSELAKAGDYKEWQRLLYQHFGIIMPDAWFVPFLSQEPFLRESQTLIWELEDKTVLTKDELWSLLHIAHITEVNLYKNLLVSEQEGSYTIAPATTCHNCYTYNEKLASYIVRNHADEWQPLSQDFERAPQLPKTKNEQLTQWLMDHAPQEEEAKLKLTEALLGEDQEAQLKWTQKLDSIQLDTTWELVEHNEVHLRLLAHICEMSRPEHLLVLFDKLILIHGDGTIPMKEIQQADDKLELCKGEQTYTLSLSKVLNTDNQEEMCIIRDFAAETVNRGLLSHTQADTLFKRAKSEEPQLEIFRQRLDEKRLINAHQLAFVLLSDQIDQKEIAQYARLAADGKWYYLQYNCYLLNDLSKDIIQSKYLLNELYDGLADILRITDDHPFAYGPQTSDLLLKLFLFQDGCRPDIFAEGLSLGDKLDYLFKCWKTTDRTRTDKTEENWQAALGFNPKSHVIHPLGLESEQLREEVEAWWQEDPEKTTLLAAIGCQTEDSPVVRLRQYLLDPNKSFDENELPPSPLLLINTLKGLATGFGAETNPIVFREEDERVSLIHKIQERLVKDGQPEFCLLVHRPGNEQVMIDPEENRVYNIDRERMEKLLHAENNLDQLYENTNVWAYHEQLASHLSGQLPLLPIKQVFNEEFSEEHSEAFYSRWSAKFGLRLFKSSSLQFDLYYETDETSIHLGQIQNEDWYERENEEGMHEIHYSHLISSALLQRRLEESGHQFAAALQDFEEQLNEMLRVFMESYRDKGQEFQSLLEGHRIEKERKNFLNILESPSTVKYSHEWFVAYLGYLDTFNEVVGSLQQKSLTFNIAKKIKIDNKDSRNFFMLEGAGQLIPESIENFTDFELNLHFRNPKIGRQTLSIASAMKKGQHLQVYSQQELPHELITQLADADYAEISFTPVLDLLERLKTAFTSRDNMIPWKYIKDALPALHFIYGPPGTGKTTKLMGLITRQLKADPEKRFLVLTPTNKAADVLTRKIIDEAPGTFIHRLGKPTDIELEKIDDLYQSDVDVDMLRNTSVLAMTIHRLPYFTVAEGEASNRLFQLSNHWDHIIFDEASMITLPYIVFAIKALQESHPNAHFTIAGDPKQLPPVQAMSDEALESMEIADENIYKMLDIDSFNEADQELALKGYPHTIDNLSKQYRSVESIGHLFSHFSYGGLLQHHRKGREEKAKELPEPFKALFKKKVSFIHFPLHTEIPIYQAGKLGLSSYQTYSALLAMEMVKHFDESLPEWAEPSWKIGLVAPYKAHVEVLTKLIDSMSLKSVQVMCDTVHGFQGDECDIILFTATPNNLKYTGHVKSLLTKRYLYNVAISRARDYLWVLHPQYQTSHNPLMAELLSIQNEFDGEAEHIPATRVEQALFGQPDHIEQHCHQAEHESVNLFNQREKRYFIKASKSAVDIQLYEPG